MNNARRPTLFDLLATFSTLAFATASTNAGLPPPQQLLHGNGEGGDVFGWSVAISGDTALVGARDDDVGLNTDQGTAHVYRKLGFTWVFEHSLSAADGAPFDGFGVSVAISGDTAIVGAFTDNVGLNNAQGSAYIFTRSGTTWTQQARLTAIGGAVNDLFGFSVALSGDTALVGAPSDDVGANADQGSAYVFTRSGEVWTQQAQLTAAGGAAMDDFGFSVALDGNTAVVGAPSDDVGANTSQGSAYVFTRSGTAWTQQAQLTAADGASLDSFGESVALDGNTALVGVVSDDVGANVSQGSASIFTRSGSIWTQQAQLTAPDGESFDNFGDSVAISGNTAVVGARTDQVGANAFQGSAGVFTRSGTVWTHQAQLTAPGGAANDAFGFSVAISAFTAIVGTPGDNVGANLAQGSAWVFTLCSVAADANNDNQVNSADLSVLLSQFGQNVIFGTGADFNNDGLVNAADLSVLLSNFGNAC